MRVLVCEAATTIIDVVLFLCKRSANSGSVEKRLWAESAGPSIIPSGGCSHSTSLQTPLAASARLLVSASGRVAQH
jgi:hypothetical protein